MHPYLERPPKPRAKYKSQIKPNFYYNSAGELLYHELHILQAKPTNPNYQWPLVME